ncbi:MAG: hypothetical protein AUK03_02125 [Anaerolineae bacterium CG2_30_64_16]|nr:MAG: hypothetical protein AUK03_02125 [Anaerolineae bacterium CG2_30_64_16]
MKTIGGSVTDLIVSVSNDGQSQDVFLRWGRPVTEPPQTFKSKTRQIDDRKAAEAYKLSASYHTFCDILAP